MEPILIPDCSVLYLDSNDMNSFKSGFLEKKIIIKTHKYLVCYHGESEHKKWPMISAATKDCRIQPDLGL